MSINLKLTLQIDKDRPPFDAQTITERRLSRKTLQVFFFSCLKYLTNKSRCFNKQRIILTNNCTRCNPDYLKTVDKHVERQDNCEDLVNGKFKLLLRKCHYTQY